MAQPGFDLNAYERDFLARVLPGYESGVGPSELPADADVARSLIPPGTAAVRDFSHISPEIPELIAERCVGCMECVTECPDTAILGRVALPSELEAQIAAEPDPEVRQWLRRQWVETAKFYKGPKGRGEEPGLFGIFIDPTKCKGCGECVAVCGSHEALKMVRKEEGTVPLYRRGMELLDRLPPTPPHFIRERVLVDLMLAGDRSLLYVGGAGSCPGCGEATALRMMLAATGFAYGRDAIGLVAATGCNTVYGSTYPYNPFLVAWTNSLFENVAAVAMGIRTRWNQRGWEGKKLWAIGGDGALYDIGFQALSRLLASGLDVNVLVLDTQVYSNTGGQASTASFSAQVAKMAAFGAAIPGKIEARKEIARIAMMHPDTFVAQTTCAHPNHFYRAILDANSYPGPSLVNVYATCQPEHGVADDVSAAQAKLAVESRAFPLLVYDPRKGPRLRDRLSLQGNPAAERDWATDPRTGREITFIDFARTEARFAKHFDAEGRPSPALLRAQEERLANWRMLQELAGKSAASAGKKA